MKIANISFTLFFLLCSQLSFSQSEGEDLKERYSINKAFFTDDECSLYLKGLEISPTRSTAKFLVSNNKNVNKTISIQSIYSDDYSEIETFGIELSKKLTIRANTNEEFSIRFSNSTVIIFFEGINLGGKNTAKKFIRLKSSGELEKHFSRERGTLGIDLSRILKRSILLKKYQ